MCKGMAYYPAECCYYIMRYAGIQGEIIICENGLNLDISRTSETSTNKRCDMSCVSIIADITYFDDSLDSGSEIAST